MVNRVFLRSTLIAAFSLALSLRAGAAGAQTLRGVVVDAAQRPVTGVVVLMLDSASIVVARALSGERGDFRVAAARPGAYRLRTMRIGYRSTISQPIALLAGGEVMRQLVLSGVSVSLDTVRIVDRSSCRISSDSAGATFEVWEQARTALIAAQLTAGARAITATTVAYDRTLEPDGRRVTEQASRIRTDYVTQPWRGLAADSLHRAGYVVTERDNTTTYRAPSIDALLSGVFVEDHCFHLITETARPDMVGVAFEPSPERKHLPEIRGTLWVDRRTTELHRLDYRYVNVSSEQESAGAGGEMSFARLANGGWAISSWEIRMPVLEVTMRTQQFGGTQTHVAEIKVSGGELALATIQSARGRDTLWSRPPLVLDGTVVDSASGAGVAGAHVELSGTGLTGRTDSRGRFAIGGVLPGVYALETTTPALDAIGAVNRTSVSFIDSAAAIQVRLPAAEQLAARLCGGPLAPSAGVIVGSVHRPGDSTARRGTGVAAEWTDAPPQNGRAVGANDQGRRINARTDASGTFRICGVPVNTALTLQAGDDSTQSAVIPVRLAGRRFARVDVTLDRVAQHGAVFSGMVVDSLQHPITGADVTLPDLALTTLSDQRGSFRLSAVPAGEHRVLVRRVGYGALDTTFVLREAGVFDRKIILSRVTALDSVVVSGAATDPRLREFEDHRRLGLGHFFTRAELAKLEQHKLADILWQTPGAGLFGGRSQAYIYSKRAPPSTCTSRGVPACFESQGYYVPNASEIALGAQIACYSLIYLDGTPMNAGYPTRPFDINSILPHQIEAIEWYSGPSQTPARYAGLNSVCGVLVIHSRRNP